MIGNIYNLISFLYSCGVEGQIYEWNTVNWYKKELNAECEFNSLIITK